MASKFKTTAIESCEVSGHEWIARVVIAYNPDPKSKSPYHVRRIRHDGVGDTSTHAEYYAARKAADATVDTCCDEGARAADFTAI